MGYDCWNAKDVVSGQTFDSFCTGNSNLFAVTAAKAVAKDPGAAYNPLFLYGESGVGKTHLLYAIGNAIVKMNPDYKVACVTTRQVLENLVEALQRKSKTDFNKRYHDFDVLLLDDFQVLVDKQSTQEEIYNLIEYYHQNQKQVVIASGVPLEYYGRFEQLVHHNIPWLLQADLFMDDEIRRAVLEKSAKEAGVELPEAVKEKILQNAGGGFELRGAALQYKAKLELNGFPYC